MRPPPLVSVALCTYQGARFLPAQLDSLLAQDYPNLEVVVVDDASTDESLAILQAYAARDRRIRVHRNQANLGFQRNFEAALARCRGELIAPCDQDDVWRADKLSLLRDRLGSGAAAYCDSELIDSEGRSMGRRFSDVYPMRSMADPANLLFDNCVAGHALLLRRPVVEAAMPFPDGLFHDWWMAFVAAGAGGLTYCAEPLVRHRVHAGSVTDFAGLLRPAGKQRPRGYGRARHEPVELRLRAFAAYRGAEQAFFSDLLSLWLRWRGELLSPRLALFLLRHRDRLFAFRRKPRRRRVLRALGYLMGFRARCLLRTHAYGTG